LKKFIPPPSAQAHEDQKGEPNMPRRIAISTSDGKTIHQHFGKTKEFHIVSIDETEYNFIETRTVDPCCNNFSHHEESFDNVLKLLGDCEAVVVGKIGPGASDYLTSKGMRIFETVGYVDDILNEFCRNLSCYFPEKPVND
jgi:predicted Fe-Mo cluster-binding NifX family protein